MSLPKSCVESGCHVALELFEKIARVEDVNAHAGQRHVGAAWHGGRVGRLFHELGDEAVVAHRHHAKRTGLGARHGDAAHGAVTPFGHVVGQHERVVHFVDVVTGQHHHVVGAVGGDDVLVLVHRIRGSAVPALVVGALLRGQQIDELIHLAFQKRPTVLQVTQQAVRLVLGDHADAPYARVEAVRQREIDDAKLAAKINRRLGALVGQVFQAASATPRQHQSNRTFGKVESQS